MNAKGLIPHFNPDLNWGHLLSAGTFVVFGLIAFYNLRSDVSKIEVRMSAMEESMRLVSIALSKIAEHNTIDYTQNERISFMDRRLDVQSRRIERLEQAIWSKPAIPQQP